MRIALVNPTYPPDHCGVGDYTAQLAQELARRGNSVGVWTAQGAPASSPGIQFRHEPRPWGVRGLGRIASSLRSWSPQAVLFQYSPYLYAPRSWGIRPALPVWLASLRSALDCPVLLVAHEQHYPLGLTPDRLAIGIPQFSQFVGLGAAADSVILTYEVSLLKARRLFPWKKSRLHWIPVGTNIDPARIGRPARPGDLADLLRVAGVPDRHKILLQFGSSHPTKLGGHSVAALDAARKALGPDSTSLVFTGEGRQEVEALLLKSGRMDLKPFVHGLGYLAPWQISLWMKRADLVLAPFHDGVSTRRTTVMAALAHRKTVVTTRSYCTEKTLDWGEFCSVVDGIDAQEFAGRVVGLLRDHGEAERLAEAGMARFEREFSWTAIGDRVLEVLAAK